MITKQRCGVCQIFNILQTYVAEFSKAPSIRDDIGMLELKLRNEVLETALVVENKLIFQITQITWYHLLCWRGYENTIHEVCDTPDQCSLHFDLMEVITQM